MSSSPFARKRRRTAEFRYEVEDSTAAKRDLVRAERELALAQIGSDEDAKTAAADAVAAAGKAYEECFQVLTFRQDTHAVEELETVAAAREKDGAKQDTRWWTDPLSFPIGLIAACAVEVRMTPEQWVAELSEDRWTIQDRSEMFQAAMRANTRTAYDAGKG